MMVSSVLQRNMSYHYVVACNYGQPYNITVKVTGCAEDEFTCDDGQCIDINTRCDQIINCRDESDEKGGFFLESSDS